MWQRDKKINNQWESFIDKKRRKRAIISRSTKGIFNKKEKWKIIIPTKTKPIIYRGFSTKQQAIKKLKKL